MRLPLPTNHLVTLTLVSALVATGVAFALATASPGTDPAPAASDAAAPSFAADPATDAAPAYASEWGEPVDDEAEKRAYEAERHAADEADER